MKLKQVIGLTVLLSVTQMVFAAETIVKEETTPPPAEGALPASQIPPITTIGKPIAGPENKQTPSTTGEPAQPSSAQ